MVTDETVFKEALEYFKSLTKQELSSNVKQEIIARIEDLSFIFRYLQRENERLKKEIQGKANLSSNSVSSAEVTPVPWWLQLERERSRASTGMVDLFDYKSPYKKRTTEGRLSTPFPRTSSGQRKPEPLRARNRGEQKEPPAKEVKRSKHPPLPAIKTRPRPKLLRERTYVVIEPVYIKGPEDKVKLPEIKKPLKRESLTPTPVSRHATSRGVQLTTPKRNKTLAAEVSPVEKRTRQTFNPSSIAPQGDIPSNVFWFPM